MKKTKDNTTSKRINNLIAVAILLLFCFQTYSQTKRYNLVFESGQSTLSSKQKTAFKKFARNLYDGELISVYPLKYDSSLKQLVFSEQVDLHVKETRMFAQKLGFEWVETIENFSSPYRRNQTSAAVRLIAHKHIGVESGLQDIYFPKAAEYYSVNPKKDTVIYGSQGTVLYISAGSLLTQDEVRVELKEYYTFSDLIKNNLPTISNGKMLVTGGSLYVQITDVKTGNQVQINPAKGIQIDFASVTKDPDMEIFIADKHSKNMNWVLPSKRSKISESDGLSSNLPESTTNLNDNALDNLSTKNRFNFQTKLAINIDTTSLVTNKKMYDKLTIYDLGYINCDKFYEEPTLAYSFEGNHDEGTQYYLVFKEVRGVLVGYENGNSVNFGNVPKDKEAVLMAVKIEDEQIYFYKTNIVPQSDSSPKIALKEIEESFLDEQLALLK